MVGRRLVEATRHGRWIPFYRESRDPVHGLFRRHALAFQLLEVVAWGLTIVFAAADVVTTVLGLSHPVLTEAVPLTSWVLARFGWPGLVLEHLLALGVLATLWYGLPRPYRLVVPLEGAWAGYLITHSNLVALIATGLVRSG